MSQNQDRPQEIEREYGPKPDDFEGNLPYHGGEVPDAEEDKDEDESEKKEDDNA